MGITRAGASKFFDLSDVPSPSGNDGLGLRIDETAKSLYAAALIHTFTKIYDGAAPATKSLAPLTTVPWTGRLFHVIACPDGYVYFFGGDPKDPSPPPYATGKHWRLNPNTGIWEQLTSGPSCGGLGRGCYHNGKIYIPARSDSTGASIRKIAVYTIATDSWQNYDMTGYMELDHTHLGAGTNYLMLFSGGDIVECDYDAPSTGPTVRVNDTTTSFWVGELNGEVYYDKGAALYKWDETSHVEVNTGYTCPNCWNQISGCSDANDEYLYMIGNDYKIYRSDGLSNFADYNGTSLGSNIRAAVVPLGWNYDSGAWVLVAAGTTSAATDPYADGGVGYYPGDDCWELASQQYEQGNFLVINSPGVPVICLCDDLYKFTINNYGAIIIDATGTWKFYISKAYGYADIDIWRAQ